MDEKPKQPPTDGGKPPPTESSPPPPPPPDPKNGDSTSLGTDSLEKILDLGGNRELLRGLISEREISLVYIDRHQVHNYLGAEGSPARPQARESTSSQPHRIRELVVNPIATGEIAQLQRVYLEPQLYATALARFRQGGLLILCGPPRTGKRAAALHLLSQIRFANTGETGLFELNPDQRLADLNPKDLPAQTGLLLESPGGDALTGVTTFQLKALRDQLGPALNNNGLIIVVEKLPTGFPGDQRSLVIDWRLTWSGDALTANRTILANHLREFADGEAGLPDPLDPALADLVAQAPVTAALSDHIGPGQVADLALLLLPVLLGKRTVDEALARFGVQVRRDVADWFRSDKHDLEQKIFLIAAAVFNGALVEEVEMAERDLLALVRPNHPQPKAEAAPAFEDPFSPRFSRTSRLEVIQADLRDMPIPGTHYGDTSAKTLVLRNEAWQQAVLYHLWEDVTPLRDPLLAWLTEYSSGGSARLRMRAAAAVGALAKHSFPLIEASILRSWAGSGNEQMRRSAAQVLGITIWDEKQSAATARLLHHWATMTGNVRFQWTAATAYAGLAGLRLPQQALADLKRVALSTLEQPLLLPPIFQSMLMHYTLAAEDANRRLALLQELQGWAGHAEPDEKDRTRRMAKERAIQRTGLLSFGILLMPEQADPIWRQMVTDAGMSGEAQKSTVGLIVQALSFRQPSNSVRDHLHPRKLALDLLHRLITSVDKEQDEELSHNLTDLLHALIAHCRRHAPDTLEMLQYHIGLWDDVHTAMPALADVLY